MITTSDDEEARCYFRMSEIDWVQIKLPTEQGVVTPQRQVRQEFQKHNFGYTLAGIEPLISETSHVNNIFSLPVLYIKHLT